MRFVVVWLVFALGCRASTSKEEPGAGTDVSRDAATSADSDADADSEADADADADSDADDEGDLPTNADTAPSTGVASPETSDTGCVPGYGDPQPEVVDLDVATTIEVLLALGHVDSDALACAEVCELLLPSVPGVSELVGCDALTFLATVYVDEDPDFHPAGQVTCFVSEWQGCGSTRTR